MKIGRCRNETAAYCFEILSYSRYAKVLRQVSILAFRACLAFIAAVKDCMCAPC